MNKLILCAIASLCCSCMSADITWSLQHEIDGIEIALTRGEWTVVEKAYLAGMSDGLHKAIEIIHEYGIE